MKKRLQTILLGSITLLSTVSFGQTKKATSEENLEKEKTAKTYFDIMVNVASSNIYYGGANSALSEYKKSNNGIQAGMSFQAGITPAFSVVSEFYFMRKGGKLKANNPLTFYESTFHLNTLELPLLARVHAGRFYVNAGPSVAYNLSGKNKIGDLSTKLSFSNSVEGFRRFDAGLQMGGGVEFPFKQKRIALDIRYVHGLTNLSYTSEMYNRALMISVHFSKAWKTNPLGKK